MKEATIQLETLTCPSCLQKINNAVKKIDGVDTESINVLFNSSKVKLNFDDQIVTINQIENSIENLGYGVIKSTVVSK